MSELELELSPIGVIGEKVNDFLSNEFKLFALNLFSLKLEILLLRELKLSILSDWNEQFLRLVVVGRRRVDCVNSSIDGWLKLYRVIVCELEKLELFVFVFMPLVLVFLVMLCGLSKNELR
jgi:hypothetical protein